MWLMLIPDCSAWLFLAPPKQGRFAHICSMYPRSAFHGGSLALAKRRSSSGGKVVGSSGLDAAAVDRLRLSLSFPAYSSDFARPSSVWLSVSASHPPNPSTDDQTLDLRSTWCIHARLASARRRGGGKRPAQRECPSNASSIDLFDNF